MGQNAKNKNRLNHLLVATTGSVARVHIDRPGRHVPVQFPVLNLDLTPARFVGRIGQGTDLGRLPQVGRGGDSHHNFVHWY